MEELMKGEEIAGLHLDVKWMQSLQKFFKGLACFSHSSNSTFDGGRGMHTENGSPVEDFNMCTLPV